MVMAISVLLWDCFNPAMFLYLSEAIKLAGASLALLIFMPELSFSTESETRLKFSLAYRSELGMRHYFGLSFYSLK